MTQSQVAAVDSTTDAPSVHKRRRWVLLSIGTLVVVAVAISSAMYWHWRHSANDLETYGNFESGPATVGTPMYANAELDPTGAEIGHRVMDLHGVKPRVVANTAGARIELLTCTVANTDLGVGVGEDLSPCAQVLTFKAGKIDVGFSATELIYKITPTRVGTLHIQGADVTYSCDGRDGTQHVGIELTLHVEPARR